MQAILRIIAVVLTVAASVGCAGSSAIRGSNSVDVYLVSSDRSGTNSNSRVFHGYPITVGARRMRGAEAEPIKQLIAQVYAIDWPGYRCAFQPRYGLAFHSFLGSIDVLICPGCREVRFYDADGIVRRAYLGPHSEKVLSIVGSLFRDTPDELADESSVSEAM